MTRSLARSLTHCCCYCHETWLTAGFLCNHNSEAIRAGPKWNRTLMLVV